MRVISAVFATLVVVTVAASAALKLGLVSVNTVWTGAPRASPAAEGADSNLRLLQKVAEFLKHRAELALIRVADAKAELAERITKARIQKKPELLARLVAKQDASDPIRQSFFAWTQADAEGVAILEKAKAVERALDRPGTADTLELVLSLDRLFQEDSLDSLAHYDTQIAKDTTERLLQDALSLVPGAPQPSSADEDGSRAKIQSLLAKLLATEKELGEQNVRVQQLSAQIVESDEKFSRIESRSSAALAKLSEQYKSAIANLDRVSANTAAAEQHLAKLDSHSLASSEPAPPPPSTATSPRSPLLSGTWQNPSGERFDVDDDGTHATVSWRSSSTGQALTGRLTRDTTDGKSLDGPFLLVTGAASYRLPFSATYDRYNDRLIVNCDHWPLDRFGYPQSGRRTHVEVWKRNSGW